MDAAAPDEASTENMTDFVRSYWAKLKPNSPIYNILLEKVEIISALAGTVKAQLRVIPVHLNSKGTLHGTVIAALTDWAGGLAITSMGRTNTGLSTDIHTTFVSTAKEGDLLEIEGRISRAGRVLAFTTVEIRKVDENGIPTTIIATGTHTKYIKQ